MEEPATPATYMRLSFNMPGSSRANPACGEEGNGPLGGSPNENKIENFTIFVYRSSLGPNADASTPIRYAVYADADFEITDRGVRKLIKLNDFKPTALDRVLVAANCGDLTGLKTLGDVRNHELSTRWRTGQRLIDYTAFTMASAYNYDGQVEFNKADGTPHSGAENDPFEVNVEIERTAARIDLADVDNHGTYEAGADRVNIDNILVVNDNRAPSWLLKRVTLSTTDLSAVDYCGDERIDPAERPLNYVLEPRSLLKSTSTPAADLADWYGASTAANVEANYASLFNATNSFAAIEKNHNGRNYTLAYTNENTQPQEMHLKEFATGIALKATYVPEGFVKGETFWRYSPGDGTNKVKYFTTENDAEAYKDAHEEEHGTVTGYPGGICYYHAWIRHANVADPSTGNHDCCPMEYAIVRNNVYELSFTFHGPGTPTPHFDDPESVVLHVYVRPWHLRKQSTILM